MNRKNLEILLVVLILSAVGCSTNENSKLAKLATEYADRQAKQSKQVLEVQKELATGSRNLVEADSLARKEMAVMQRQFQEERLQLAKRYDALEMQRQDIATERNRAPIVAAAITNIGLIIVCLLPLTLCFVLLFRHHNENKQELLNEFMIANLLSSSPVLQIPSFKQLQSKK